MAVARGWERRCGLSARRTTNVPARDVARIACGLPCPAAMDSQHSFANSMTLPDGTSVSFVVPLPSAAEAAASQPLGDWAATGAARAALAALRAVLACGAVPLAGSVDDLQDMGHDDGYVVSRRQVCATDGFGGAVALWPSVAALRPLVRLGGEDAKPTAVLLTHAFEEQGLRLCTLILPQGDAAPDLLAAVFGADARVALRPADAREACAYTDVALGDSQSLSAEDVAALPSATRALLRAAQRTQLLAACAACIEAQWAGGFRALTLGVARVVPALAEPLDALASSLLASAARGRPTRGALYARVHHAESLEAQGRFDDAAAMYKAVLAEVSLLARLAARFDLLCV